MPINPFDSVAPASAAEATHIQVRRAFAPVSARWAITSALKAQPQEERETGIERHDLGDARVPERRGEHERRIRAEGDATQRVAGRAERHYARNPASAGPQPRRPFVHAEDPIGGGRQPVLKRRLLEVLEAVEARRHPVAGGRHLAGDLGIATLVGMHEAPRIEGGEPEDRERDEQSPRGRRQGAPKNGEQGGGAELAGIETEQTFVRK
jgi:hypothetical protein